MLIVAYLILSVLVFALVIDWRQTLRIARNPLTHAELNPIIGRHPTERRVNVYFAVVTAISIAGTLIAARIVPEGPWFIAALSAFAAITAFEWFVILRNRRYGL